MRLPGFIGIGAMRSGSTTLWRLLDRHEGVFLPELKELHFFDNRWGRWDEGVETYARHFEAAPPDAVCGEFTPSYLFIEDACDRIKSVVPDARLLVILRNPVDRAWSHYWYMMAWGQEDLSFEKALERETERTSRGDVESLSNYSYVARGFYHEQLVRFERCFSREQLHVTLLDDLKQRPAEAMADIYRHVGVPVPQEPPDMGGPRFSARHPRLGSIHPTVKRVLHWGRGGDTLLHRASFRAARALREANLAPGTPRLDPRMRERLGAIFAESNERLSAWLGRPLPWQ